MNNLVDVHTHFLTEALISVLESRSDFPRIVHSGSTRTIEYGPGNARELLPEMVDFDVQQEERRRHGITNSVLSTNIPGVDWLPEGDAAALARDINDEMAELVASGDGRDAALAVLPMNSPERAAAELERSVGLGLSGAMFYSNVAGRPLDVDVHTSLFDSALTLGVPLAIHPTYPLSAASLDEFALIPGLGFLVDTTTVALRLILGGIYEDREELKLVLHHAGSLLPQLAGRIDYEAALHGSKGMGRLEVKPSERMSLLYTDTVCAWQPALAGALALVGSDRVMFGSDFPFWGIEATTDLIGAATFGESESTAIRSQNAFGLYPGLERGAE